METKIQNGHLYAKIPLEELADDWDFENKMYRDPDYHKFKKDIENYARATILKFRKEVGRRVKMYAKDQSTLDPKEIIESVTRDADEFLKHALASARHKRI